MDGGGNTCCPELLVLLHFWQKLRSVLPRLHTASLSPAGQTSLTVPFFPKPHKSLGEEESEGWAGTEHLTQQPQPSVLLPAKGTY